MSAQTPVGWIDPDGHLFPLSSYNPAHPNQWDGHKKAWRQVAIMDEDVLEAEVEEVEEAKDPEAMPMCLLCRGSGEGQFDGAACRACGGSGVER